jgi:hypothetical protein
VANLFFRGHVYIMVTFVTRKDINGRFAYLPGPILSIVGEGNSAGKGDPSSKIDREVLQPLDNVIKLIVLCIYQYRSIRSNLRTRQNGSLRKCVRIPSWRKDPLFGRSDSSDGARGYFTRKVSYLTNI